jgi:hypothetical protein
MFSGLINLVGWLVIGLCTSEYNRNLSLIMRFGLVYWNVNRQLNHAVQYKNHPNQMRLLRYSVWNGWICGFAFRLVRILSYLNLGMQLQRLTDWLPFFNNFFRQFFNNFAKDYLIDCHFSTIFFHTHISKIDLKIK